MCRRVTCSKCGKPTFAGCGAHIEQVYPTELDALRANKNNTDPARRVRFLPYGIAVSVLDASGGDSAPADEA